MTMGTGRHADDDANAKSRTVPVKLPLVEYSCINL